MQGRSGDRFATYYVIATVHVRNKLKLCWAKPLLSICVWTSPVSFLPPAAQLLLRLHFPRNITRNKLKKMNGPMDTKSQFNIYIFQAHKKPCRQRHRPSGFPFLVLWQLQTSFFYPSVGKCQKASMWAILQAFQTSNAICCSKPTLLANALLQNIQNWWHKNHIDALWVDPPPILLMLTQAGITWHRDLLPTNHSTCCSQWDLDISRQHLN